MRLLPPARTPSRVFVQGTESLRLGLRTSSRDLEVAPTERRGSEPAQADFLRNILSQLLERALVAQWSLGRFAA
jgi:hypothetical protein